MRRQPRRVQSITRRPLWATLKGERFNCPVAPRLELPLSIPTQLRGLRYHLSRRQAQLQGRCGLPVRQAYEVVCYRETANPPIQAQVYQ
ncbi:hypothetical protein NDU88_000718 [Pleurodeles waltl]|uniref:Uncharacterized protein n=1 Tax=Pleurodeles waltl TaxID=8319 RepID=A0AAV7L7G3_PLEWA|nr:hypothetical protein NDU88_000718 [Pleurodeles waltl]